MKNDSKIGKKPVLKKKKKIKEISKLKLEDIKKNSSSDVLHSIKRIKAEENRIVGILVVIILIVIAVTSFLIFTTLYKGESDVHTVKDGPLVIEFSDNEAGMSDIISFTERDGNPGEDGLVAYNAEFTISNDKGVNSWYAIYLDDYIDMINLDECENKQIDKNNIYFSIDNSEPKQLSTSYYDDKYMITEGIVSANSKVVHKIKVWHTGYTEKHYHGKIVVEYLR